MLNSLDYSTLHLIKMIYTDFFGKFIDCFHFKSLSISSNSLPIFKFK